MTISFDSRREFLAAAALAIAGGAHAQFSSDRPVRIVVPSSPGGILDQAARILAKALQVNLKTAVIVENRAGAGGRIGAQAVVRSPPDGHTLLLISNGTLTYTPAVEPDLGFDPYKDLTPISQVSSYGLMMVVHPSVPAKSVQEFIAYARSKPDQVSYASSGSASGLHFAGAVFASMADIKMTHVPYKGSAPAMQDVLGNTVQLMFAPGEAITQVDAGKLRVLGVTTLNRDPRFPQVPTISESGLPGYNIGAWMGLYGPANLPSMVQNSVHAALQQALASEVVRKQFIALGMNVEGGSPQQLESLMRSEGAKLKEVATQLKISADK